MIVIRWIGEDMLFVLVVFFLCGLVFWFVFVWSVWVVKSL